MLITCPYCGAAAKLKEIPPIQGVYLTPRYRLACSNCAETVVGAPSDVSEPVGMLSPALDDDPGKA